MSYKNISQHLYPCWVVYGRELKKKRPDIHKKLKDNAKKARKYYA